MTQIWKCIGLHVPSTTLNNRDLPVVWLPTLLSWTLSWYNISMGVFHNIYIVQGYTILLNKHFKKLSVCFCTTLIGWVFLINNFLRKDFSKKKITLPELLRYNNKIIYDSHNCRASIFLLGYEYGYKVIFLKQNLYFHIYCVIKQMCKYYLLRQVFFILWYGLMFKWPYLYILVFLLIFKTHVHKRQTVQRVFLIWNATNIVQH